MPHAGHLNQSFFLPGILIKYYNSYSPAFFAGAGVLFISSMLPSIYWFLAWITSQCCKHPKKKYESTEVKLCLKHALENEHGIEKKLLESKIIVPSVAAVHICDSISNETTDTFSFHL